MRAKKGFLVAKFANCWCISGGIASGKSTATAILKSWGYEVIDADTIAHEVLDEKALEVAKVFGASVLKCQGIDRQRLGEIVFNAPDKLKALEAILSPSIKERILKRCEQANGLFFVDIPLYFERISEYGGYFEGVVLIYAPKDIQLKRLMQRNSLSKASALARLNAQMDIEKKLALADIVVQNVAGLPQLERALEQMINLIKDKNEAK